MGLCELSDTDLQPSSESSGSGSDEDLEDLTVDIGPKYEKTRHKWLKVEDERLHDYFKPFISQSETITSPRPTTKRLKKLIADGRFPSLDACSNTPKKVKLLRTKVYNACRLFKNPCEKNVRKKLRMDEGHTTA